MDAVGEANHGGAPSPPAATQEETTASDEDAEMPSVGDIAVLFAQAKTKFDVLLAFSQLQRQSSIADHWRLPLKARLEYIALGTPSVVHAWLQKHPADSHFCASLWFIAYCLVCQKNRDDPNEREPARLIGALADWQAPVLRELDTRPCRTVTVAALADFLSWLALVRESALAMVHAGLVAPLLGVVTALGASPAGSKCLLVLRNLAQHSGAYAELVSRGALKTVLPFIKLLGARTDDDVRAGLDAASLVCRLCGRDEEGPGADAIQANPLVVSKLVWFLSAVVDAGTQGVVLRGSWDPANIAMDFATLAASDRNKPQLAPAVGVLVKGLRLRVANARFCGYAVVTLSLLRFDSLCAVELRSAKAELLRMRESLAAISMTQEETCELQALMHWFDDAGEKNDAASEQDSAHKTALQTGGKRKSTMVSLSNFKGATVVDLNTSSNGAVVISPPAVKEPRNPAVNAHHVFVSYALADAHMVHACCERLAAELPLWRRGDQGDDSQPSSSASESEAVASASCVVCFFSPAYKASGRCRAQLTRAHELNKPVVFVRVDDAYAGDGWVKFIMAGASFVTSACANDIIARVRMETARTL